MADRTVQEERDLKFLEDSTNSKPDDRVRKNGIADERQQPRSQSREKKRARKLSLPWPVYSGVFYIATGLWGRRPWASRACS